MKIKHVPPLLALALFYLSALVSIIWLLIAWGCKKLTRRS